jgi:L-ascorbate metabolism protein UlaG (beta-lactamase superfamily)
VSANRLTWLGHATVLLELGGLRVLTDPVLRGRVAHLRRHAAIPPPISGPLDAVLISHAHRDHLDLPTLRALDPPPERIVVPGGVAHTLRRLTGVEVRELAQGEALDLGDGARVRSVPALHESRRRPLGPASDAVGFLIEAGGRRVYFAGDTEVFAGMAAIGPLDAALIPIWGWGPRLGPGHMDPEQAVEALRLLRPALAIPIHWGTLLPIGAGRHLGHLLRDPVEDFARAARERCPDVRVAVLAPGEDLVL